MMRILFAATMTCLFACGSKGDPSATTEPTTEATGEPLAYDPAANEGNFGARLDDQEFDGAIAVLPPHALAHPPAATPAALPPRAMLENLPAIAAQGKVGSCEAESFGYGLGAYTAARAPDGHVLWDASKPENEPSPAFLYAWQHKIRGEKCPKGSGVTPYLSYLVSTGAPSLVDVPYKGDCGYLDSDTFVNKVFPDAGRLRIGSFATFRVNEHALPLMKELLAAGQAIGFSGLVLKGYGKPKLEHGVLYETETIPKSGHGQLVVGYDDTIGDPARPGAFLVQNSFGTKWPHASGPAGENPQAGSGGGRVWMSYESFVKSQRLAAVAYPKLDGAPAGEKLTASATKGAAPAATIARAYEVEIGKAATLVIEHWFEAPVLVQRIHLTEPSAGKTMETPLGQFLQSGYVHFARTDGQSFRPGAWTIRIEGENTAGASVVYAGTFTLAGSGKGAPLAGRIVGPTGKPVTIESR